MQVGLVAVAIFATLALDATCFPVRGRSQTFKAAVIEHAAVFDRSKTVPSPSEVSQILGSNLDSYEARGTDAQAAGAEVIVFPEDGLTGFLNCKRDQMFPYLEAVPESGPVPCTDSQFSNSTILRRMSCLARKLNVVIVFDMGEIAPCDAARTCPDDGHLQFNTQVAMDVDGSVLARYRKQHLFHEPQYDAGAQDVTQTFTTKSGLRFGMMVCFDIMFKYPSTGFSPEMVDAVLLSDWWVNTPPTFTATQWFQAWARHHGVALLAAGGSMNPAWQYSGSGIIAADGTPLAEFYNDGVQAIDNMQIATLSKSATVEHVPLVARRLRDPKVSEPGAGQHCPDESKLTAPLAPTVPATIRTDVAPASEWGYYPFYVVPGAAATVSAASGPLNCTLSYKFSTSSGDQEVYAVLAFAGVHDNSYYEEFCAVAICQSMTNCAEATTQASTIWDSFVVTASSPTTNLTNFGLASMARGRLFSPAAVDVSQTQRQVQSTALFTQETLLSASTFGIALE